MWSFSRSTFISGFEYWANPDQPQDGFITWQTDGVPSYRLGATSVGPDMGDGGAMVGQRRISEEPMVRNVLCGWRC